MRVAVILVKTLAVALALTFQASARDACAEELFVAEYNIENLFDAVDDPKTEDFDAEKWDAAMLAVKLKNLATTIRGMNDGRGPDVLGVCEVENRAVLEALVKELALPARDYKIVHQDSPDERGIDCAILYDAKLLKLLSEKFHPVTIQQTRDIVEAKLGWGDATLTVFMNHWPSQNNPEEDRLAAAKVLRTRIDDILKTDPTADVLCMGDFNEPKTTDPAIKDGLRTVAAAADAKQGVLFNTMAPVVADGKRGTFVYDNRWNPLDHIIVSEGLLNGSGLRWKADSTKILDDAALLLPAKGDWIPKPHPTRSGKTFDATGVSDHLPILCLLTK
ncbi:MAG: hypothetical protein QM811_08270 [Pirellulales bacterium]